CVQPQRDLVAHRPAGQEHRGLVPQQLGDTLLQRVRRWIQSTLLVAHDGGRDRGPHPLGGARLRVAVQVDRWHSHGSLVVAPAHTGETTDVPGRRGAGRLGTAMSVFTETELAYLTGGRLLGRIATV